MRKKQKSYINIIDIGSSKITVLVASANPLKVIAKKRINMTQLTYISLNDPITIGKGIAKLMDEIEHEIPGFKFNEAYVCVNSFNLETSLQRCDKNLTLTNPISQEDLDSLTQSVSSTHYVNKKIIHSFAVNYLLDGQKLSQNPVGSFACYLTMQALFITLPQEEYKTIENMIQNCHIGLSRVICAPYASSLSFAPNLKQFEKSLVVEIGSHFSYLVFYVNGILSKIEKFDYGISTIVKQLTSHFKISEREAIALISENSCKKSNDAHLRTVNLHQLQPNGQVIEKSHTLEDIFQIISISLNEYFDKLNDVLERKNFKNNLQRVILTGGGANISDIEELAGEKLDTECVRGIPKSIEGFENPKPEDASLIGSVLYASFNQNDDIMPQDLNFFEKIRYWIKENL